MSPESSINENQANSHPLDNTYIQLQKEQQDLQHQEACLHAWNTLQGDIHQLHQLFVDFNKIVDVNYLIYSYLLFFACIYDFLFISLGSKRTSEFSRK